MVAFDCCKHPISDVTAVVKVTHRQCPRDALACFKIEVTNSLLIGKREGTHPPDDWAFDCVGVR